MNKKLYGGAIGVIGFLLSPLSWWNDIFVNFPIAYVLACAVNFIHKGVFLSSFIVFYWITNILGFILLQKGIEKISESNRGNAVRYSWKQLARDVLLSVIYTFLILISVKLGIIKPIP